MLLLLLLLLLTTTAVAPVAQPRPPVDRRQITALEPEILRSDDSHWRLPQQGLRGLNGGRLDWISLRFFCPPPPLTVHRTQGVIAIAIALRQPPSPKPNSGTMTEFRSLSLTPSPLHLPCEYLT